LFGGCAPDSADIPKPDVAHPGPSETPTFFVDDVHIKRIPDDVAVHWDLVYDAHGTVGDPVRCKWRIVNREGEVVQVGIVNVAADADDAIAGTVYPDEVPGVPETGQVRC
jgi:hypothetical protein